LSHADLRMEFWDWPVTPEDDLVWPSYRPLPCISQWAVVSSWSDWETVSSLSVEESFLRWTVWLTVDRPKLNLVGKI